LSAYSLNFNDKGYSTLFFYNLSFINGVGLQMQDMWFKIRREKAFRDSQAGAW
jgi:hypothetical protein